MHELLPADGGFRWGREGLTSQRGRLLMGARTDGGLDDRGTKYTLFNKYYQVSYIIHISAKNILGDVGDSF